MSVNAAAVPNGRYFIVNNVTTPYGALSVNFTIGGPLALISYGTSCGSVWNLTRYTDDTYKISPYGAPWPDYQVVEVDGILTTANSSITQGWNIKKIDGLYTIQDSAFSVFWDVQEAKPEEQVTLSQESSGEGSTGWWLLPGVGCA